MVEENAGLSIEVSCAFLGLWETHPVLGDPRPQVPSKEECVCWNRCPNKNAVRRFM